MKTLQTMTELEILALDDEQVEKLVKIQKMQAGVRLMERPVEPEYEEEAKKDMTFYKVEALGDICFDDIATAESVSKFLQSNCENAYYSSYGSAPNPRRNLDSYYARRFNFEISTETHYSPELAEIGATIEKRNAQLRKQYNEQKDEYEKYAEEVKEIVDGTWDKVYEVRRKFQKLRDLRDKLSEYQGLAENKKDGLTFFLKAYTVTDEELALIQSGDLGDKPKKS